VLCPRCRRENRETAVTCAGCGAPLALGPDPAPRPLDMALPLDRRDAPRLAAPPAIAARHAPPPLPAPVAAPRPPEPSGWELGPPAGASDRAEPGAPGPAAASPARSRVPAGAAAVAAATAAAEPVLPAARPAEPDEPEIEVGAVEIHLRRAPSWRRGVAWAVDAVPLAAAGVLAARSLLPRTTYSGGVDGALDVLAHEGPVVLSVAALLAVAAFTYFTLSHALAGASAGKALLGLRVVAADGRRPSLARSAARSAAAIVSTALLGLGCLVALFDASGRALHDFVAGTYVVERP
jgi:uncharacterized RDD family membrane protein YckC